MKMASASASAFASVGLIFLLSQLVVLVSAQEQQGGQSCPASFKCGTLGVFGYPFTTIFYPSCGLCILNCTDQPFQTIRLGNGAWYDIINAFTSNMSFLLADSTLQHLLKADSCDVFGQRSLLPRSRSVSVTVLHNQVLWNCPNFRKSTSNLGRIRTCGSNSTYRSMNQVDNLPGCSPLRYPDYLFLELSNECSQCISDSGRCQDLQNGEFRCVNRKKGRRKLIQLILLGILTGCIVLGILGVVLWRLRKVKLRLPAFASRNISADTTKTDGEMSKMYFSLPVFSYSELEAATNYFDHNMELGDGAFGTVYYGKLKDGREVAVKRLYERNYRQLEQYMNEIEILTCLRHQNLVSLYGCTSRRSKELLLVYEYVPNGTVADHLHGDQAKFGILTWPVRMNIAIETARALSYLHASDIIHRDVKSNNILLDNNFSVKVADFGLSRLFRTDVTHISTVPQGTPGYLDPEYHQCYQLTYKSDVYSFGVVLIELISSLPAIDINRKDEEINLSYYAMKKIQCCALDELVDRRLGIESNYKVKRMTTLVAELAFQCLQPKKDFRPSMDEVLETLKSIESADYEVLIPEEKKEKYSASKIRTEAENNWLLRNAQKPPSPKTVMHKWTSSNFNTLITSG